MALLSTEEKLHSISLCYMEQAVFAKPVFLSSYLRISNNSLPWHSGGSGVSCRSMYIVVLSVSNRTENVCRWAEHMKRLDDV